MPTGGRSAWSPISVAVLAENSPPPVTAEVEIPEVARLMTDYNLVTLPVVDADGRPIGVVSDLGRRARREQPPTGDRRGRDPRGRAAHDRLQPGDAAGGRCRRAADRRGLRSRSPCSPRTAPHR